MENKPKLPRKAVMFEYIEIDIVPYHRLIMWSIIGVSIVIAILFS